MRKSTYLASISYDHNAVAAAKSPGEKFSKLVKDKYDFTVVKAAA